MTGVILRHHYYHPGHQLWQTISVLMRVNSLNHICRAFRVNNAHWPASRAVNSLAETRPRHVFRSVSFNFTLKFAPRFDPDRCVIGRGWGDEKRVTTLRSRCNAKAIHCTRLHIQSISWWRRHRRVAVQGPMTVVWMGHRVENKYDICLISTIAQYSESATNDDDDDNNEKNCTYFLCYTVITFDNGTSRLYVANRGLSCWQRPAPQTRSVSAAVTGDSVSGSTDGRRWWP